MTTTTNRPKTRTDYENGLYRQWVRYLTGVTTNRPTLDKSRHLSPHADARVEAEVHETLSHAIVPGR